MRLVVSVIAFVATACGGPDVLQPELNRPFSLRAGQTAEFPDIHVSITFRAVPQEGRCPRTVVCVWEGNAEVQFDVRQGESPVSILLNTGVEPRSAAIGAYRLRLRELAPEPPVPPLAYLATLELQVL